MDAATAKNVRSSSSSQKDIIFQGCPLNDWKFRRHIFQWYVPCGPRPTAAGIRNFWSNGRAQSVPFPWCEEVQSRLSRTNYEKSIQMVSAADNLGRVSPSNQKILLHWSQARRMEYPEFQTGTDNIWSNGKRLRKFNHLQMSLQTRQHFLLNYFKTLSVGPAGVRTSSLKKKTFPPSKTGYSPSIRRRRLGIGQVLFLLCMDQEVPVVEVTFIFKTIERLNHLFLYTYLQSHQHSSKLAFSVLHASQPA